MVLATRATAAQADFVFVRSLVLSIAIAIDWHVSGYLIPFRISAVWALDALMDAEWRRASGHWRPFDSAYPIITAHLLDRMIDILTHSFAAWHSKHRQLRARLLAILLDRSLPVLTHRNVVPIWVLN